MIGYKDIDRYIQGAHTEEIAVSKLTITYPYSQFLN